MILITKDGIIYDNGYNPDYEGYRREKVDSLIPYLNEEIEVEDNILFEDIFKLIINDKDLIEVMFSSHLGHFPLQPFIDDFNKTYDGKDREEDIEYMRCHWSACEDVYKDETEIEIYVLFAGWGKWGATDPEGEQMYGGIAIEFSSLSSYKHLPFRVDNNMDIYPDSGRKMKGPILSGKASMTVYDVIGAILYEITFPGLPDDRDETMAGLKQDVEDIKSGKAKTVGPFKTVEEMWESLDKDEDEE